MEVLVLQVFVSLLLVSAAIVLLAYSVKQADHEHADRLALLPIEDGDPRPLSEIDRSASARASGPASGVASGDDELEPPAN